MSTKILADFFNCSIIEVWERHEYLCRHTVRHSVSVRVDSLYGYAEIPLRIHVELLARLQRTHTIGVELVGLNGNLEEPPFNAQSWWMHAQLVDAHTHHKLGLRPTHRERGMTRTEEALVGLVGYFSFLSASESTSGM